MNTKLHEDAYLAPSIDVINLSLESAVLAASDGSTIDSYESNGFYEWDAVSKSGRM